MSGGRTVRASPGRNAAVGTALAVLFAGTAAAITSTPPTPSRAHLPPAAILRPDPILHDGKVDTPKRYTQGDLCAATFHTTNVRPSTSYTNKLKALELGDGGTIVAPTGVTYQITGEHLPGTVADYELDHLISLELGGDPTDPHNLWLQPWERKGRKFASTGSGAESKDLVENRLHREVCASTISLADAQKQIASDWLNAK